MTVNHDLASRSVLVKFARPDLEKPVHAPLKTSAAIIMGAERPQQRRRYRRIAQSTGRTVNQPPLKCFPLAVS